MKRTKFNGKQLQPATPAKPGKIYKMPPRWSDDLVDAVRFYASQGYTQRELAEKFQTHIKTIEGWMKYKPLFREAWEKGKKEVDEAVERAFLKRALGYSHPDVQVFIYKGDPIIVPITKHYPPDSWAAHKWLTIRQRERWADVQKLEVTNNVNILQQNNINFDDFSMEELLTLEKMGLRQTLLKEKTADGISSN